MQSKTTSDDPMPHLLASIERDKEGRNTPNDTAAGALFVLVDTVDDLVTTAMTPDNPTAIHQATDTLSDALEHAEELVARLAETDAVVWAEQVIEQVEIERDAGTIMNPDRARWLLGEVESAAVGLLKEVE